MIKALFSLNVFFTGLNAYYVLFGSRPILNLSGVVMGTMAATALGVAMWYKPRP